MRLSLKMAFDGKTLLNFMMFLFAGCPVEGVWIRTALIWLVGKGAGCRLALASVLVQARGPEERGSGRCAICTLLNSTILCRYREAQFAFLLQFLTVNDIGLVSLAY
jgi:hypothetical protein